MNSEYNDLLLLLYSTYCTSQYRILILMTHRKNVRALLQKLYRYLSYYRHNYARKTLSPYAC